MDLPGVLFCKVMEAFITRTLKLILSKGVEMEQKLRSDRISATKNNKYDTRMPNTKLAELLPIM